MTVDLSAETIPWNLVMLSRMHGTILVWIPLYIMQTSLCALADGGEEHAFLK